MSALMLAAIVLTAAMQGGPQELETIIRDNTSNVEDAKQAVARTPGEWEALWRLHAGARTPLPKIDFSKRTVVAVFLGTRPSAGYAVEVSGTRPVGKTLVVEWREQAPRPGEVSAQVMTSPSHLVSIPRFEGQITFQKVGP